jgi:hypothetical protein
MFVHFAAKTDRIRQIAPHRGPGLFKFAKQKGFFSASGKQCLDCLKVRASHRKNVCRPIDQHGSKRLTAQIANVHACFRADFDRIKTWRLAAHCVHTSRNNFDVLSVPKQTAKKPFRNRAAADITCADKEDAFHNSESASERNSNLESNWFKSILRCRITRRRARRSRPTQIYPRGSCSLNLCQMYKTKIAPMMDTINPPR